MEDTLKQLLGARRLRQRGLALALADSAVLAMEIVGEFLSLHQDKAIFTYFRWWLGASRLSQLDPLAIPADGCSDREGLP